VPRPYLLGAQNFKKNIELFTSARNVGFLIHLPRNAPRFLLANWVGWSSRSANLQKGIDLPQQAFQSAALRWLRRCLQWLLSESIILERHSTSHEHLPAPLHDRTDPAICRYKRCIQVVSGKAELSAAAAAQVTQSVQALSTHCHLHPRHNPGKQGGESTSTDG
jgi:hypothetical protein